MNLYILLDIYLIVCAMLILALFDAKTFSLGILLRTVTIGPLHTALILLEAAFELLGALLTALAALMHHAEAKVTKWMRFRGSINRPILKQRVRG